MRLFTESEVRRALLVVLLIAGSRVRKCGWNLATMAGLPPGVW